VFALRREIAPAAALAYIAVQIIGGVAGTFLAHAMFDEPLIQFSAHARTGGAQWLSEAVATFALVFTILMTLRTRPEAVPMAVALVITAGYWFTASTSFANPAVTIARGFSDTFAGIRPENVPAFIVAQMLGAVAALYVCRWLTSTVRTAAQPARSPAE
jgi:glycerol uptake facilitator-like aquaporin